MYEQEKPENQGKSKVERHCAAPEHMSFVYTEYDPDLSQNLIILFL